MFILRVMSVRSFPLLLVKDSNIITNTRRLVFYVLLENASVLTEKAIRHDRDSGLSRLIFLSESTLSENEGNHLKLD